MCLGFSAQMVFGFLSSGWAGTLRPVTGSPPASERGAEEGTGTKGGIGIIVGPVGNQQEQEMIRGIKDKNGRLELEFLGPFLFTPMYGKYGFET